MGVDAEMFARIKGRSNWLKPENELSAAYDLASTIGASNFIIMKGGDYARIQHHALSIIQPIIDSEDADYHGVATALIGKTVWTQDGPEIVAGDNEQFVKVHLWSRYYGEDYARGDWPTIRAVAEWLEMRFAGCEVWYGGDSSGICAEHLDRSARDKLNDFWLRNGRKSYNRMFSSVFEDSNIKTNCLCCEVAMISNGGGQGHTFWYCDGCDGKAISNHREIKRLKRGDDFFAMNTAMADQPS